MKFKFTLILSLWCSLAFAQLNPFTLTIFSVHETCNGNGSVNFNVSNATVGSTIVYAIYKVPNYTTAIATTTSLSYGGLSAGNYRIIATQTLGGVSNISTADAIINNQISALTYTTTVKPKICSTDGSITVNVISGNAVSYAITAGPKIISPQASKTLTGLPAGTYTVSVVDNCGQTKVLAGQVVEEITGGFTIGTSASHNVGGKLTSCYLINRGHEIVPTSGAAIIFPLTYEYIVHPPSGGPSVVVKIVRGAAGTYQKSTYSGFNSVADIPFYDQDYSYDLKVTDGCGQSVTRSNNIVETFKIVPIQLYANCSKASLRISAKGYTNYTLAFLDFPPGFVPTDFNANYIGPHTKDLVDFGSATQPVPEGNYTIKAVDACNNRESTVSITIKYNISSFSATSLPACGIGQTSFVIQNPLSAIHVSGTITAGPPGFPTPYNIPLITDQIGNKNLRMLDVPGGNYTIKTIDECGIERTRSYNFPGLTPGTNTVTINEICGSFSLALSSSGSNGNLSYFIQKYDSNTGSWVHPITGVATGGINLSNASQIFIGSNNNLTFTGKLRVVKVINTYVDNTPIPYSNTGMKECFDVIKEFEINQVFDFQSVNAFTCPNGLLNIGISATGKGTLTYAIIAKDGFPISINNGTSSLFTGLTPGVYDFQIKDICGNTLNRQYDITKLELPKITPASICNGQPGKLSVEGVPYLNFKWWKEGNPGTILSTTNQILFSSFNSATDAGTYCVELTSPVVSSCVNQILKFVIPANPAAPNAGADKTVTVCKSQTAINLFDYIGSNYDNYGTWKEITSSGNSLSGSNWIPNVSNGTYQFQYEVNGLCSGNDVSVVTINLIDVCSSIAIEKTYTNSPSRVGEVINYTFNIKNTGNSTLTDIEVKDLGVDAGSISPSTIPNIPSGATAVVTAVYTLKQGDIDAGKYVNQARVEATDGSVNVKDDFSDDPNTVSPDDPTILIIPQNPSIKLVKTAIANDNSIEYTFTIKNTGNVTLYSLSLSDNKLNLINRSIPLQNGLAPGASVTISEKYILTKADKDAGFVSNTARVTAQSLQATNVEDISGTTENNDEYTVTNVQSPISIPNLFTPNGNGRNDEFEIKGLNQFLECNLVISNRWGNEVYKSNNYKNTWTGEGLNEGTYFYLVRIKNTEKNEWKTYKGYITLIRAFKKNE